jgi:glycosyltransferase involved in cell wall biosynthesis
VADTELFLRDVSAVRHPVLDALDALPRPRLGYLGNLAAYKIDLPLIYDIARQRPLWSIVLVGPTNLGDTRRAVTDEEALPNVHWLGAVPHAVAPAVIDRFDVALLPSARHDVMQASFPLKFFEYLLRGKPVVARPLPALEPFRTWLDAADDATGFIAAVERRLGEAGGEAERRRAFAGGFGWTERMAALERLRQSVVA